MGVVVRDIEGQVPEERQVVDLFEEGILGPA
jgi:hypothetical protein